MNRYLTKLLQLTLLVTFFAARSTFSYATPLSTADAISKSELGVSLSNDSLAEDAIARTQNETVASNLHRHANPFE